MSRKNMYKKVILTGGFASRAADGGAAFCAEVVNNLSQPVRVLECIFGLSEKSWRNALEKDLAMFQKLCPDKRVEFTTADPGHFVEQIKNSDVVYFRGGETPKLYECLTKISGWQDALKLKGKVIVGASAGAYVLSEVFVYSSQPPELRHGFGLLPVKTVTHYRSTFLHGDNLEESRKYWDQVDKIMANQEQHLRAIKLREGEFKVVYPL